MTQKRVLLPVRRFRQQPAECGIAAAASLANYYDRSVDYDDLREMVGVRDRRNGLYTSHQARLLNELGFAQISIVTADLTLVDFSWRKMSKWQLVQKLGQLRAYYGRRRDKWMKDYADDMMQWLEDEECDNRLVIDYDFAKHIRRSLDRGAPVGASINWTSLFRLTKGYAGMNDDIKGEEDDHAVVIRGYDDDGVFVVDSHFQCYRGKLKKYSNGYYKLSWEKLLVNIPRGDLILIG